MVKKLKSLILIALASGMMFGALAPAALADTTSENGQGQAGNVQKTVACPAGEAHPSGADVSDATNCTPVKQAVDCASGKVDSTDPTKCAALGNDCSGNTGETCLKKNPIIQNLNNIVNFLAAGVGIVVIGVIIVGGIQYSLAGGNANATSAAKQRIINGLIALAAFLFMFAFLQWLIPGGL